MKNDFYTYPDIDSDEPEDVFSNGREGEGFRVDISSDDEFRVTRRPTSRPVSEGGRVPPQSGANRTPTGRKMSDVPSRTPPQGQRPPYSPQYQRPQAQQRSTAQPTAQRRAQTAAQRPVQRPSQGAKNVYSEAKQRAKEEKIRSSKPKKGKKIFVGILCVLLALLLAFGGYGFFLLGKINYDDSTAGPNEFIAASELEHSSRVKNILIIGSDARGDVSGMRSDTMILASIDEKHHQLKLTSFLRDSLVYIPEKKAWNKLNAAFSFGGAKMVIDTLEYNFKIRIDSYVIIDFEIFTQFIDALGGVDVDGITQQEVDWLKRNVTGINIKPGKSHLTGGAALWYCRVRKIDSDFKRTQRQRKVVAAVIDQVKHTNPAKTFGAIKKVLPLITTDIGRTSLAWLGVKALAGYMHYDIFQAQVPADGTWVDKNYSIGAVLEMDIGKNADILKRFIFDKQEKQDKK